MAAKQIASAQSTTLTLKLFKLCVKILDTVLCTGGDTDAASKTLLGVATDNVKQYFLILVSLLLNINSQYTWLVGFTFSIHFVISLFYFILINLPLCYKKYIF